MSRGNHSRPFVEVSDNNSFKFSAVRDNELNDRQSEVPSRSIGLAEKYNISPVLIKKKQSSNNLDESVYKDLNMLNKSDNNRSQMRNQQEEWARQEEEIKQSELMSPGNHLI